MFNRHLKLKTSKTELLIPVPEPTLHPQFLHLSTPLLRPRKPGSTLTPVSLAFPLLLTPSVLSPWPKPPPSLHRSPGLLQRPLTWPSRFDSCPPRSLPGSRCPVSEEEGEEVENLPWVVLMGTGARGRLWGSGGASPAPGAPAPASISVGSWGEGGGGHVLTPGGAHTPVPSCPTCLISSPCKPPAVPGSSPSHPPDRASFLIRSRS